MFAEWASRGGDHSDIEAQLERFDLTQAELWERVLAKAERETASEFGGGPFPRNAVGTGRWLYLVRNLNVLLAGRGWEVHEPDGIPRILSRERRIAIVVQAGDEMTGRPKVEGGRFPRTRRDRGAALMRSVTFNEVPMLPGFEEDRQEKLSLSDYATWFLLVRAGNGKVAAELSYPLPPPGESRKIETWRERILLGVTDIDGPAAANPSTDDFPDSGIDFPVTPR